MENHVRASYRARQRESVANIDAPKIDAIPNLREIRLMPGEQIVDYRNLPTTFEQLSYKRRTDEPGASRDHVFRHVLTSLR